MIKVCAVSFHWASSSCVVFFNHIQLRRSPHHYSASRAGTNLWRDQDNHSRRDTALSGDVRRPRLARVISSPPRWDSFWWERTTASPSPARPFYRIGGGAQSGTGCWRNRAVLADQAFRQRHFFENQHCMMGEAFSKWGLHSVKLNVGNILRASLSSAAN